MLETFFYLMVTYMKLVGQSDHYHQLLNSYMYGIDLEVK